MHPEYYEETDTTLWWHKPFLLPLGPEITRLIQNIPNIVRFGYDLMCTGNLSTLLRYLKLTVNYTLAWRSTCEQVDRCSPLEQQQQYCPWELPSDRQRGWIPRMWDVSTVGPTVFNPQCCHRATPGHQALESPGRNAARSSCCFPVKRGFIVVK